VEISEFDHFSKLLPTMPTFFRSVGNSGDHFSVLCFTTRKKISALQATTQKNTHELKLEQFSALCLSRTKMISFVSINVEHFLCYEQQCRKMFGIVGNNTEELPQSRIL
jgi:hypothetical protein